GLNRLELLQYDLNAGSLIPHSRLQIGTTTNSNAFIADIRLGPDGKIYVPSAYNRFDRVNLPNLRGAACQYEYNALTIPAAPNMGIANGLPNMINIFPI